MDQPICMIDVADSNSVYYYHYDALGSVVALSDSAGDTVQVYEYDVYGQVAASDPNHTNPFLFTGRRYDTETGLYYCRARYYNPSIGRFLQTDPIGYGDGMNMYAYCRNNPLTYTDPLGLKTREAWESEYRPYPPFGPGTPPFTWPSGDWMVLPHRITPDLLRFKRNWDTFTGIVSMITQAKGYLGWVGKTPWEILDDVLASRVDPVGNLVGLYQEALNGGMNAVFGIAMADTSRYRTYIEIDTWEQIWEYNEETGKYEYVRLEQKGSYWTEVCYLTGWTARGVMGYSTIEDAMSAARTGIDFWVSYKRGIPVPAALWDALMRNPCPATMYWGDYEYTGPSLLSAFAGAEELI